MILSALSSHNLKPIKDLPVPVGCIIAALPVCSSISRAEAYAAALCLNNCIAIFGSFHITYS